MGRLLTIYLNSFTMRPLPPARPSRAVPSGSRCSIPSPGASTDAIYSLAMAEGRHSGYARQAYEADETSHAQRAHGMRRLDVQVRIHPKTIQKPSQRQRLVHVM